MSANEPPRDTKAKPARKKQPERQLPKAAARRAERAVLRDKGVVTIPQAIRDELGLIVEDQFLVTVEDGRIVLSPATLVPRDQAWFWTVEWQAREAEADADLAAGRTTRFDSDEEFLDALRARA
jgi:antitoxin PrlF